MGSMTQGAWLGVHDSGCMARDAWLGVHGLGCMTRNAGQHAVGLPGGLPHAHIRFFSTMVSLQAANPGHKRKRRKRTVNIQSLIDKWKKINLKHQSLELLSTRHHGAVLGNLRDPWRLPGVMGRQRSLPNKMEPVSGGVAKETGSYPSSIWILSWLVSCQLDKN